MENYRTLQRLSHPARCAAVVKADCYGLGAAEIVPALHGAGCTDFFVATLSEAKRVRALLGAAPDVYVLNGLPPGAEATAASLRLIPVLNSVEHCRRWSRVGFAPAALQVDTGMSRLGLSPDEAEELAADHRLRERLDLVLLMSHLADADEADNGSTGQLAVFEHARALFPGVPASLANSAGIFLGDAFGMDVTRGGAALYGIETGPRATGIRPVVSLKVRVIQLRSIDAGAGVGYGFAFRAPRPMRLATLGVGYADGWSRSLSPAGAAWLDGQRLPIVGRVSMDSFVVDVSDLDPQEITVGDVLELIGDHQSVDDLARQSGTIGYEVLTNLGARFGRFYLSKTEQAA